MSYIINLPKELKALIYTKLRHRYDMDDYLDFINVDIRDLCKSIKGYYYGPIENVCSHPLILKLTEQLEYDISRCIDFSRIEVDLDGSHVHVKGIFKRPQSTHIRTYFLVDPINFEITTPTHTHLCNLYDENVSIRIIWDHWPQGECVTHKTILRL